MSHLAENKPKLRRTPHEEVGPMYPVKKPVDRGSDLTINPQNGQRAAGQIVYLSGRVLDTHCNPIADAVKTGRAGSLFTTATRSSRCSRSWRAFPA